MLGGKAVKLHESIAVKESIITLLILSDNTLQ